MAPAPEVSYWVQFLHQNVLWEVKWVEASWNVMAHIQKLDFVFRRNGRVHLNRQGASVQSTTGFPSCASTCTITFQLESTTVWTATTLPGACSMHFKVSPMVGRNNERKLSSRNWSNHEVRCQTYVFKRQNQTRLCTIILYWFQTE